MTTRIPAWILVLCAGGLCSLGMLSDWLWFAAVFGLGLFFFILWKKVRSAKDAALAGFFFGIMTAGTGLMPILNVLPPLTPSSFLPSVGAALLLWLVPTAALALATSLIAPLLYLVRANFFAPLVAVALWTLHDELRMWAWALVTYGPGAVLEPHLGLTALGYALAANPYFLQLAYGVGLFGLTAALCLAASFLALLPDTIASGASRLRAGFAASLVAICVVLPLFLHAVPAPSKTVRIALFSANVSDATPPAPVPGLLEKVRAQAPPDVLLLPEGKWLTTFFPEPSVEDEFSRLWLPEDKEQLVIHSSESIREGIRHNTLSYDSTTAGTLATQDKRFIMPEGEYLPALSELFLAWFPGSVVGKIGTDKAIVHGNGMVAVPFQGTVFGTLLCSEALSPTLYRTLSERHGATTLVNLADPAWFRGSRLLYKWTVRIAKVHAVQNRAFFLAAQNSVPSFAISPSGALLAETHWGATDVIVLDIPVVL